MHVILWRFRARPGREPEFERAYRDDGDWARLFRSAPGFLGTELMRGTDGIYLTVDRWVSEDAYRAFRESESERYAKLDTDSRPLTIEQSFLGAIEV